MVTLHVMENSLPTCRTDPGLHSPLRTETTNQSTAPPEPNIVPAADRCLAGGILEGAAANQPWDSSCFLVSSVW
eukprot:CAMPEP_0172460840 /NCGR_PEP_ID=MMETSP1065-20121228/38552_1 /TAXON_ID=265537 /ORGANISM="Amphiprora paludosa, Strain CCMP125" /LENGTH=73 /DNA_ID=CAMNT_0013215993 /DNA_START=93 /DNA_END=311 /DNA_ORIENTATION=-